MLVCYSALNNFLVVFVDNSYRRVYYLASEGVQVLRSVFYVKHLGC